MNWTWRDFWKTFGKSFSSFVLLVVGLFVGLYIAISAADLPPGDGAGFMLLVYVVVVAPIILGVGALLSAVSAYVVVSRRSELSGKTPPLLRVKRHRLGAGTICHIGWG